MTSSAPTTSIIIGAGNRAQDNAIVKPMSSALVNRMVHVHLKVSHREWLDWAVENQPVDCLGDGVLVPTVSKIVQARSDAVDVTVVSTAQLVSRQLTHAETPGTVIGGQASVQCDAPQTVPCIGGWASVGGRGIRPLLERAIEHLGEGLRTVLIPPPDRR